LAYDVPGVTYVKDNGTGTNQSATMTGAYLVGLDGKINPNARYLYADDETYEKQLLQTRFRQEYNISASGGNENTSYYTSLGYLTDPSYVRASDFERYSGRVNIDSKILKWMKIGANIGYTKTNTNSMATKWGRNGGAAVGNIMRYVNGHSPIMSAFARDENWNYVYDVNGNRVATGAEGSSYSPLGSTRNNYLSSDIVSDIDNTINKTTIDLWSSRAYAEVSFLKDFKFTVNFSMDQQNKRLLKYAGKSTSLGANRGGIYIVKTATTMINSQQLLTYNKDLGKHHFDAMVGHEYDDYDYETVQYGSSNELVEGYISPGNFVDRYSPVGSYYGNPGWSLGKRRMESYLGRINYIFDNKYYLSGSLRGDGSSKFVNNKWGLFGSVGGGWRFSAENFMSGTKDWLDNAKLRVSYGVIGNQNGIGDYTNHTWSYGVSIWNTVSNGTGTAKDYSISYGALVNEDLTWENTHTTDLGLDFSILNGRVSGTLDFYNNLTTNSFYNQKVSIIANAGQQTRQRNSAKLRNRGFEIDVNADIIRTKDFTWNVALNGTHYKTILVSVPEDQIPAWNETSDLPKGTWESSTEAWSAAGVSSTSYIFFLRGEGRDWYSIYLYKYAGVDQESGLPMYWHRVTYDDVTAKADGTYANYGKYKDYKIGESVKTTNANEASRYECGSAIPAWIGGFTTNLKYKDFDLGMVLAYQLGGKFFSTEYANGLYNQGTYLNVRAESPAEDLIGNTWSPTNTNAKYPIQLYGATYYDGSTIGSWKYTDMALFSASYLRLKNVTIGYNLPKNILSKSHVSSMRIYASADNLFMISAAKGVDPSMDITGGWGVGQYVYPTMSSVTLGVNLEF
jgi:TonB-linked SusC/RagA family outer membrane protein